MDDKARKCVETALSTAIEEVEFKITNWTKAFDLIRDAASVGLIQAAKEDAMEKVMHAMELDKAAQSQWPKLVQTPASRKRAWIEAMDVTRYAAAMELKDRKRKGKRGFTVVKENMHPVYLSDLKRGIEAQIKRPCIGNKDATEDIYVSVQDESTGPATKALQQLAKSVPCVETALQKLASAIPDVSDD